MQFEHSIRDRQVSMSGCLQSSNDTHERSRGNTTCRNVLDASIASRARFDGRRSRARVGRLVDFDTEARQSLDGAADGRCVDARGRRGRSACSPASPRGAGAPAARRPASPVRRRACIFTPPRSPGIGGPGTARAPWAPTAVAEGSSITWLPAAEAAEAAIGSSSAPRSLWTCQCRLRTPGPGGKTYAGDGVSRGERSPVAAGRAVGMSSRIRRERARYGRGQCSSPRSPRSYTR